jgi:hypothetical protein
MGISKIFYLISPSLHSLTDSKKGTTGNRIDCAWSHFRNGFISDVFIAAAAGVTVLAGKSAAEVAEGSGLIKKGWEYIKAAPKSVKIGAAALTGLSLLLRSYKAGKIEQKYIDRASFVDKTFQKEDAKS